MVTHVKARRLERVLEDWCDSFPGYHLYYPSRQHRSAAFMLLVDALRHGRNRARSAAGRPLLRVGPNEIVLTGQICTHLWY